MAFSIKKTGLWIGGGILVLIGMTAIGAILASNAEVFVRIIHSFDSHKFLWLLLRLCIYSICTYGLYKVFIEVKEKQVDNIQYDEYMKKLKHISIAYAICLVMVEMTIWLR